MLPFALGNAPLEPWSPRSPCSRRYGCDFAFFERDSKSGELKPRYGYGSSLLAADEKKEKKEKKKREAEAGAGEEPKKKKKKKDTDDT